ncbi:MAG: radical SAM protein [Bacteroidetes bacterium]|nr:MAG: radical SAM protein [Bacteroidota bacterium]
MSSLAIVRDRWRRLRVVNFKRGWNILRLVLGYRKRVMLDGAMPMSLSIEPTTSCNLRCPECPSGLRSFTRPTGMAELEMVENVLVELKDWLVYVNLYFQGEPYLHLGLDEMVRACKRANVYTSTSTNAHFLNPEKASSLVSSGLDRLIISIDGLTQESYSAYRIGGRLEKVLEGTKNVIKARKNLKSSTPLVVWQFLVVKPNEHEVEDVKKLARKFGVDEVVIKTAQIDSPHDDHSLLTKNPKYRRYDKNKTSGKWQLRNPMKNECWRMWQGCVITWDGKIVPCCFDKDAQHEMGGVTEIEEVWSGEKYEKFRGKVFADRKSIKMCTNCSEGTKTYA